MSSEKKEYSPVGAGTPSAPTYIGVPGASAAAAAAPPQVTMAAPYPAYPAAAYTSPAYLPSSAPTYLPASYGTPLPPHLSYGAACSHGKEFVCQSCLKTPCYNKATQLPQSMGYSYMEVTPSVTAYGVPPTYLPQLAQLYSPRPGTVYVPAAYDAGARFDGHGMPLVPPPPPGVAPNAAQLAMMQGNSVILGQQKSSFLTGGSGAGYTFW